MKNSGWTNLKYLIDIINKHQSTQNINPEEKKMAKLTILPLSPPPSSLKCLFMIPILPHMLVEPLEDILLKRKKTHNIYIQKTCTGHYIWWCLRFKKKTYILPPYMSIAITTPYNLSKYLNIPRTIHDPM